MTLYHEAALSDIIRKFFSVGVGGCKSDGGGGGSGRCGDCGGGDRGGGGGGTAWRLQRHEAPTNQV